MYERWSEYFFMIGSSAAALIGLMFVVVTLTAGRERTELERGKKLYTTPIVWHLGAVLVLSGTVIAPVTTSRVLGLVSLGMAAVGVIYAGRVGRDILRSRVAPNFTGYDASWYGVAPALAYLGIGISGIAILLDWTWAVSALAVGSMALLLISIHNEWDLVTFLAPIAQPTDAPKQDDQQGSTK